MTVMVEHPFKAPKKRNFCRILDSSSTIHSFPDLHPWTDFIMRKQTACHSLGNSAFSCVRGVLHRSPLEEQTVITHHAAFENISLTSKDKPLQVISCLCVSEPPVQMNLSVITSLRDALLFAKMDLAG